MKKRSGGCVRSEKELCVICAWRETCQKKFSLPAGRVCAEFSKDLSLEQHRQLDNSEDSNQQDKKSEG